MAKPNLKAVDPSESARAALADAIEHRRSVQNDLENASRALDHARERWRHAERELEALRNGDGALASTIGDRLIASLSAGDSGVDAATLDAANFDSAARERELIHASEVFRRAIDDCKVRIGEAETTLFWAGSRVERAAARVIAESGAVERLRAGLDELEAEVVRRRIALRFILRNGELVDDARRELDSFLSARTVLPGGSRSTVFPYHEQHQAAKDWAQALEALKRGEVDTPLPL
jgi:hypothetical protein